MGVGVMVPDRVGVSLFVKGTGVEGGSMRTGVTRLHPQTRARLPATVKVRIDALFTGAF